MKLAIVPINVGVRSIDQMVGLAQTAEQLGYESVWTFEHVIVPVDYESKYPYHPSGKMGAEPDTNFIDPLISVAAMAGVTKTLKFGTGVNILSQANPLYVAKQVASLDFVSGGRFMYGVGIGWLKEEFAAAGVPFERRGARFDEYVAAIRKLWQGDVIEHQGEFLQWQGFKSYPVAPDVPIIMGGNKGKIFERIAKLGDGWFAPTSSAEELAPQLEQLRSTCESLGRDPAEIEISCMWTTAGGAEDIAAFAELGVERLIVPLQALGANPVEGMQRVAEVAL